MAAREMSGAHSQSEPTPRSSDLVAAAQGLTGIAALVLGLTYAIGASLRAGELRAAGVAVREGMAVVPIEQLLTRGINALLGTRNVVLFAGLFIFGALAATSGWAMRRRAEGFERRIAELEARESAAIATLDPEQRQYAEREMQERQALLQEIREREAQAPRRAEALAAGLAGLALVIGVVGFVPWVYGVVVVAGVALLSLLAGLMWRAGTPPSAVTFFAGLLVVVALGIIVDAQLKPRPPAPVELVLKGEAPSAAKPFSSPSNPRVLSGHLVAVTDQGWYLSSDQPGLSGKMLSVAGDEVAAGVTGRVKADVSALFDLLRSQVFPD